MKFLSTDVDTVRQTRHNSKMQHASNNIKARFMFIGLVGTGPGCLPKVYAVINCVHLQC